MFRAELGSLGQLVAAVLAGCSEVDGLAAGDLDGDLAPGQAVAGVDECPDPGSWFPRNFVTAGSGTRAVG